MSIQLEKNQSGFDGPLKKAFAVGTGGVHVALWKRQGGGGDMIDEIETPVSRLRKLPTSESILRLPQVKERVGLSRSTIYARIAEGVFPGPINLAGVYKIAGEMPGKFLRQNGLRGGSVYDLTHDRGVAIKAE